MAIKRRKIIRADYSFLGGYDDDSYFTLEELQEYIANPLEDIINQYYVDYSKFHLRPYMVGERELEIDCESADFECILKYKINLRRIKYPKDLEKLVPELFIQFDSLYSECLGSFED